MNFSKKTLIIMPHLDDEFALVPLIKKIAKYNSTDLKIIYCAERIFDSEIKKKNRRTENKISLELLGCQKENVIYLNDFFVVQDLKLWKSSKMIYKFIEDYYSKERFNQIISLGFEGGHPDHDSLALIVSKFSEANNIDSFFVPAYNSRRTVFIPVSVFRPLYDQKKYFMYEKFNIFCWIDCLKIAFIYKTERNAFLKLLPFILVQSFFSKKIYLTNIVDIESVNWSKSLSFRRYKIKREEILEATDW